MKILDRHLIALGLGRWLLVLGIGTFLIVLGDFIGQLGSYLGALFSARWWLFLVYEAVRLPGFVLTWLPLSVLVSAMITASPMIAQGTLTALGAAGIAPARVFRQFILLALLTGGVSFLFNDQVVTRLGGLTDRAELAMEGKGDLQNDRARASGWRSGKTVWSAAVSRPAAGAFGGVVAFRADESRRMLSAQRLDWRDGAWVLTGIVLAEGDHQQSRPSATPRELGFDLRQDADELADALRADDSRPTDELFHARAERRWQILCNRIAVALLPLLCLCYGLPRFICWNDRTRLGVTSFKALLWAVFPLLAVALLSRLLVSAGAQPVFLALGMLGALVTGGGFRWLRMRL